MELGDLKRDASGHIDFEQFMQIFEISAVAAKTELASRKKQMVRDRRAAINDKDEYKKLVNQMKEM